MTNEKSKSQVRREASMKEAEKTPDPVPTKSETAKPKAQPTMRLRMLQNHFVAGELKRTGEIVELPFSIAARELRMARGIYERIA